MNTLLQPVEPAAVSEELPAWKQEVNARLSAHRTRRGAFADQQAPLPGMEAQAQGRPSARVAARVAERYAKAPSYSEMLAAEAAKAARAAEEAAEAARKAHEAAQAAQRAHEAAQARKEVLWAGLEEEEQNAATLENSLAFQAAAAIVEPEPVPEPVVHYHVNPASLPAMCRDREGRHMQSRYAESSAAPRLEFDPAPRVADPLEEDLIAPALALPARVLEFPRELVAARKARPRFAEGPLREEAERTQLRIFEVEPEAISHEPMAAAALPSMEAEPVVVPEWQSIRLDAAPRDMEPLASAASAGASGHHSSAAEVPFSTRARRSANSNASHAQSLLAEMLPLHVASISDRVMAEIVDTALVLIAYLLFVMVFAACTTHPPSGKPAMIAAAATFVGFVALYQWLFFTYAEATPGMRYARIALCTFDDENPDRKTLQRRIGTFFLSALPFGLGFLWALLDDDRLSWHDRMTRTYQRSYK